MKKAPFSFIHILSVVAVLFLVNGCQDRIYETFDVNNPVYMSWDELRATITDTQPEEIRQPGKIYILGDMLLVNEFNEGIHIIDNTDPEHPEIISFIDIPGNVDMAIKDGILYVDSYVDLVALDISDLDDVHEVARHEDVFEYSLPVYESGTRVGLVDQANGVVVGWETETVREEVDMVTYDYPFRFWGGRLETMDMAASPSANSGGNSGSGTGGSMARFIIYDNLLYTIDQYNLYLFDVSVAADPASMGEQSVGWNIETVFIARDHLFIGSTTGMHIYSLGDPYEPEWKSSYWHVTSCDPVVVDGNYAYVTLRTGNMCDGDVNQLDIVNVADLSNPYRIKSYPMHNPHGLGIDKGILFICDGDAGLKVYDASDPLNLKANMLAHFEDINTFDVIPYNEVLIMIGEDGLFQYDYTDVTDIQLLSSLPIYGD